MFSHYTQHRVQRNLLYGESFSASPAHGTEAMPGQRSADGPAPPLDPIDASVVRRVRLGLIISFITVFELCVLSNLLQILDPSRPAPPWEEPFRKRRPARKDTEIPVAGARFSGQFNSLLSSGLVGIVERGTALFYSSYFCVMKTAALARSIFNGKRLSTQSPTPENVNLIDTWRLCPTIQEFLEAQEAHKRECHVYGGDFRHWFHQIPTPSWLQQLFGIRAHVPASWTGKKKKADRNGNVKEDVVWRALPMGWSWSPVLAQAVAWSYLTYRCDAQEPCFFDEDAFRGNRLPTTIRVRNPETGEFCGFATVYYDNFLIMCTDGNLLNQIRARLLRNSELLQVLIKEGSEIHCNKATFCSKGFDYLGVHFQGVRKRDRDASGGTIGSRSGLITGIEWYPTKTEEWEKGASSINQRIRTRQEITLREAATLIGQAVFALTMAPQGLRRTPQAPALLRAAREVGILAHQRKDWDSLVQDAPSWLEDISSIWEAALQLSERGKHYRATFGSDQGFKAPTFRHILTTDASTSTGLGWASFLYDEAGLTEETEQHVCGGRNLEAFERDQDIYILEVKAALEGLRAWCLKNPGSERVCLVVDNSGAAFTLRNGYTSNALAMSLLLDERYVDCLARVEDVILVISEDNPSDCCSRIFDRHRQEAHLDFSHSSYAERCAKLAKCVSARRKGWNWASEKRRAFDERTPSTRPNHDPVGQDWSLPNHMYTDGQTS